MRGRRGFLLHPSCSVERLTMPTACRRSNRHVPFASMSHFAHMFVLAATALSVACASLGSGKVLCTTASDHVAIEPTHGPGRCPAAETDTSGDHSEPCNDVAIGSDE